MQSKVCVTYGGYIGAWYSFLFMIHFMNPARRHVSPLVFAGFAVAAVYAIAVGLVMRKKLLLSQLKRFVQTLERLSTNGRRLTLSVSAVP